MPERFVNHFRDSKIMGTPKLTDEQPLREQLQIGFDEADRGELAVWNLEEFLAKMHRQHAEAD